MLLIVLLRRVGRAQAALKKSEGKNIGIKQTLIRINKLMLFVLYV